MSGACIEFYCTESMGFFLVQIRAKLNYDRNIDFLRLNLNFFRKILKKNETKRRISFWSISVSVVWKLNIDGNQNDALFTCVVLGAFFASYFYRCICHSESLFSSLQYFNHSKHNEYIYKKKLNASLPVVEKCHRDISLSTLPLHSLFPCCKSARTQQTHSQNRYTKSAARLSVQTHSKRMRCDMMVYKKNTIDATYILFRWYG